MFSKLANNSCVFLGTTTNFADLVIEKERYELNGYELKLKNLTKTKVTIYHENNLRRKANANSKMYFLNVQALGLTM